jgi:hypothetical protein
LKPAWNLIGLATIATLGPADPARAGGGDAPDDPWRTIETERFIFHYPLVAEAWALDAAGRAEAWRDRVVAAVGNDLDRKVTVVLRDPYADANGMAYPLRRSPRTELWITPPDSASEIGWNRRWDEGLLVHEDTHLVHLGRPSRGGVDRLLDTFSGVGPVARKVPRWVAEGYATVVEGDETGFGRPYSATLAADLRRLATEGAMPTYAELNGSPRWRGGGFAYGIGASYLRWLRARTGPDSLRHLWARLAAVESRTFEDAFRGLFGEDPDVLYGRFVAELTVDAMRLERERPPEPPTRYLDRDGGSGWPDVSPDGRRLVLAADGGSRVRLEVWPAVLPDQAEEDETASREQPEDPEDVPDLPRPEPDLQREEVRLRLDRAPSTPRWLDDNTILFTGRQSRKGRIRTDLYLWHVDIGAEQRLTRGQDLRDADPAPSGDFAVAVRTRWGATQLVRIDLTLERFGTIDVLEPPSTSRVVDSPRVSPDGNRLAFLAMLDGGWRLYAGPMEGPWAEVPLPPDVQPTTPAWHPDGEHLLVSLGARSWMEIASVHATTGETKLWTSSHGGALAPAVGDGAFFWLDEDARGRDVHRDLIPEQGRPLPALSDAEAAAIGPLATVPARPDIPLTTPVLLQPRTYGRGPGERRLLVSGAVAPGSQTAEGVLRSGDPIGRRETLYIAGWSRSALASGVGGRVSSAWRGLPVLVEGDLFAARDSRTGTDRAGAVVQFRDFADNARGAWSWRVGGWVAPALQRAASQSQAILFAGARLSASDPAFNLVGATCEGVGAGGQIGGEPGGWWKVSCSSDLARFLHLKIDRHARWGGAPSLSFGGVRDAVIPEVLQLDRVLDPAWVPQVTGTEAVTTQEVRLGPREGGLFLMHQELDDLGGFTVIGADGTGLLPRQPFLKLPAMTVHTGVGCRVQKEDAGWERRPCTNLSDWTAWTSLTWSR